MEMRTTYGDLGQRAFRSVPFFSVPSSIGPPMYEGSPIAGFVAMCACNVFERRGVIERLEGRSGVQLSSERSAAEAGSRPRLQHGAGGGEQGGEE